MNYPSRRVVRVADPAVEPVSVAQAKSFLRIDNSEEDTLIGELIQSARISAELETGKSFITQSWQLAFDDAAPQQLTLPNAPVQSITSVKKIAEDDSEIIVDLTTYHVDARGDGLVFEAVPSGHRIEVVYVAGYGDASSDVPMDIVQGILVHVAWLYEQRDSIFPPTASMMIYSKYREVRV